MKWTLDTWTHINSIWTYQNFKDSCMTYIIQNVFSMFIGFNVQTYGGLQDFPSWKIVDCIVPTRISNSLMFCPLVSSKTSLQRKLLATSPTRIFDSFMY